MQEINATDLESQEVPRIVWMKAQDAIDLTFESNPKKHDIGGIIQSIQKYGWQELPKYDEKLGAIKAGNGRVAAIAQMEKSGESIPRGVARHKQTSAWVIPVLFGVDALSEIEAKGYLIDSNNLTLMGGDFTALDVARAYDDSYLDLLQELADEKAMPVSIDGDDLDSLMNFEERDSLPDEGDAESEDVKDSWCVMVECKNEEERAELIERLDKEGFECQALVS